MRDSFPFIDTLTLPIDAGPTEGRIEIDGRTGEIRVYDNSGQLYGFIIPADGIGVTDGFTQARLIIDGAPILSFDQGAGEQFPPSVIGDFLSSIQATLNSGNFPGEDSARVVARAQNFGQPSRVILRGSELAIDAGPADTVSGTTDGSGFLTFTHGASSTPKVILATEESPLGSWVSTIDTIGATTARAQILNSAGALASTAVQFRALVIV